MAKNLTAFLAQNAKKIDNVTFIASDRFVDPDTGEAMPWEICCITAAENAGLRKACMLGITPFATDTLDDRKLRLLSRYNENIPYTRKSLAALLESLCGAGGYILTITTATFTVNVKVALGVKKQETIISETLERILPYNMVFTVELLYNTWGQIKNYTWGQLKQLTWREIKEEVLT